MGGVTSRRVALVADARTYVGPPLARLLAERGHDLVLGDPKDDLVARLGGMDEFAHACAPFLDGTSRFTTGQFLSYSGGWS